MENEELSRRLREVDLINQQESIIQREVPGCGNMNLVLRIKLNSARSLILKQAKPWVEKFPSIPAPLERLSIEYQFYQLSADTLKENSPKILGFMPELNLLIMEDLGQLRDCSDIYSGADLSIDNLDHLYDYITRLHEIKPTTGLSNRSMRELNHQHIFDIPLRRSVQELEDIKPGLSDIAAELYKKKDYLKQIEKLGREYMKDGSKLTHGDFYPGSWMIDHQGRLIIIDPEFAFCGCVEFDLGVMLAHFHLAGKPESAEYIYNKILKNNDTVDTQLIQGFTGAEVMRRLLGVAQLPLSIELHQIKSLLELSEHLVLNKES